MIGKLCDELFLHIFSFLVELQDFNAVSLTCRNWYRLIGDEMLWSQKFNDHFWPHQIEKNGTFCWRAYYMEMTLKIRSMKNNFSLKKVRDNSRNFLWQKRIEYFTFWS